MLVSKLVSCPLFQNEGFSLTGKRSSWHGNRELSILLYTLVLTSVWLKASTDLEICFRSKLCPRSIWCSVWFSDQKLRRAKKRKVKVSQFAIAINTLTHPQPTHFTVSFTRLNWPFITRVPGVYLWLFLLSSSFFTLCSLVQCNTDQVFISSKTVSMI